MKKKFFYLAIILSLLSNLNASLLPDSLVLADYNEIKSVEKLEIGDQLITIDDNKSYDVLLNKTFVTGIKLSLPCNEKIVSINIESEDGICGNLKVGGDQKFYNLGGIAKLKHKLLKNVKAEKRDFLELMLRVVWISAKDLKVGMELLGINATKLTVTNVEFIEPDEDAFLYDISIGHPHTFFLADSSGNVLLTHNIIALPTALWIIGICSSIGAIIGVRTVIKKTRGKASKKAILSGALVGGIIAGGVATGVIYFKPILNSSIKFIKNIGKVQEVIDPKFPKGWINKMDLNYFLPEGCKQVDNLGKEIPFTIESSLNTVENVAPQLELLNKLFSAFQSFVNTLDTLSIVVPGTLKVIDIATTKIAEKFDLEINNNIDKSNVDKKDLNTVSSVSEKANIDFNNVVLDTLHDKDGKPVRDANGRLVPIFTAEYNVR